MLKHNGHTLLQAIKFSLDVQHAMQERNICLEDKNICLKDKAVAGKILKEILREYPDHEKSSDVLKFSDGSVVFLTNDGVGVKTTAYRH